MKQKLKQRVFSGILCLVWMFVIFNFSGSQGEESAGLSDQIVAVLHQWIAWIPINDTTVFIVRKLAHFSEYAILGILLLCFLRTFAYADHTILLTAILFVCLYACTDEIHQLFVAGRSGQFRDVMIDTAGGMTGIVITYTGLKFLKGRKKGKK